MAWAPSFGRSTDDANSAFDSEQFKSAPRTCRLLCGRLEVRKTAYRTGQQR